MRMIWKGNLGELQFENKMFTRCEETAKTDKKDSG